MDLEKILDCTVRVEGFSPASSAKFPIFPLEEESPQWDEYGQTVELTKFQGQLPIRGSGTALVGSQGSQIAGFQGFLVVFMGFSGVFRGFFGGI